MAASEDALSTEPSRAEGALPDAPAPIAPAAEAPAEAAPAAKVGAPASTAATKALPARFAYPLAALAFVMNALAIPGTDVWPLAFVAFVPLVFAVRGQPPRRALALGLAGGTAGIATAFYWLLGMLQEFSDFPTALCVLFMAVLCAYQAGRFALWAWLTARASARGWPFYSAMGLAFVASELVYPLLFPWYLGVCVHQLPAMLQVADLGGPILVGVVLLSVSIAIAELLASRVDKRRVDWRPVALGIAMPLITLGYGAFRLAWVGRVSAEAPSATIGIAQGNMPLHGRRKSLDVHSALTSQLKERGAELVVWSESAISRSYAEDEYKTEIPEKISRDLGVPTIFGVTIRRPRARVTSTGKMKSVFFNTALLTDERGEVAGRYDKQHLLAFGEYMPLGETFPILYEWSRNSGKYSPGVSLDPILWRDHRLTALVCYEDILPALVNKTVRHADPDLLVNLTNDAWFGDTTEPWIHLALSKFRAIEHRRFLVRSTNSGVSAIVDAAGRVVVHGGTFTEEALIGQVRFMRAKTLYERIGDVPWWIATAAIALMAFVRRERLAKLVARAR